MSYSNSFAVSMLELADLWINSTGIGINGANYFFNSNGIAIGLVHNRMENSDLGV